MLRSFLINLVSLAAVTKIMPGFVNDGGLRTLALGAAGLMILNTGVIPLLRVMFLPLNILTLGLFAWVVNVVALYLLVTFIPQFRLMPYSFPGVDVRGSVIPAMQLNVLWVAIITSFLVGLISHFLQWLIKK